MKRNIGLRNTPKSLIIKHDKKQKNDKRCEDELSSCNPCTDLLCDQCDLGTDHHPVSEKTQDGTDRTCGRCAVAPEESGYPYMGGIIFLIATVVTSLFYVKDYPKVIPVVFLTLGFGIIGFLDDYLKVVLRRSDGLLPWQKFSLQVVVTAVFTYYLVNYTDVNLSMRIPFWTDHYLNIGWLAIPVLFFAVIGTVNGVNFTDGLDGLASSVTLIVAVFFTVVSIGTKSGIEPITCAVVGGLMGFLLFNVYPAKVFMGDTGSLALGGFVAGAAYMMQMPLFILLVGLIYLVEVLSVIIQVTYFKKTHGKRIFKMAPIHHHFELCGWSETRVVAVFSIITAVMCLIALLAL